MDGFLPNLYIYIVETWKRTDKILVTTPFSRSQEGLDCWKMACLHPISWRNGWILTKLAQLYCCDMKKNWLDFSDLDPIFKVQKDLDCWKMACLHLSHEGMDGFWPNLHNYIAVRWKRLDLLLVTLTSFSRSQEGSDCWKMAFLHPISRMNRWILTKLVQLYCWDRDKN